MHLAVYIIDFFSLYYNQQNLKTIYVYPFIALSLCVWSLFFKQATLHLNCTSTQVHPFWATASASHPSFLSQLLQMLAFLKAVLT